MLTTESKGWVKMNRGTIARGLRGDAPLLAAWAMLNAWTNYEDGERQLAGHDVELGRGQCVTSTRGLATAIGVTHKVARRCLEELAERGMVSLEAVTRGYTRVTVGYLAALSGHSDGHSDGLSEGHSGDDVKPATGAAFKSPGLAGGHSDGHTEGHSDGHKSRDGTKGETELTETESARSARADVRVDPRDGEVASFVATCRLKQEPRPEGDWPERFAAVRAEVGITFDDLFPALQWALHDARDPFWRSVVVDPDSLGKHWATLAAQWRRSRLKVVGGGF